MPLSPRHELALREAVDYVVARFAPAAVIAAGTIVRGAPDPASDLDLVVVHHLPWRQRVQRFFGDGVPAEIFVNSPAAIARAFASEQREARPVMAHMIATGRVMFTGDGVDDRDLVAGMRERAAALLASPPPWLTDEESAAMRYGAATLHEDAVDVAARDPDAAALLLARALEQMLRYWFRARGDRLPRAKELFSGLDAADPALGRLAREAIGAGALEHRLEAARRVAEQTVGAAGFFAWESDRQPVPSSIA